MEAATVHNGFSAAFFISCTLSFCTGDEPNGQPSGEHCRLRVSHSFISSTSGIYILHELEND